MESQQVSGLYSIFMRRLNEIRCQTPVIPFPYVFEKLCRNFSMNKQECFQILRILKKNKVIDVICGHGVRILVYKKITIREIIV